MRCFNRSLSEFERNLKIHEVLRDYQGKRQIREHEAQVATAQWSPNSSIEIVSSSPSLSLLE